MIQSFYTGNSGLNANKDWLSVISDNIANVNTVGYKGERANFEDLVSSSLSTFSNGAPKNQEIGGGAFMGSTVKDFSQGTFMNTNTPTDLALDGEGFFMVDDDLGGRYYTRNGQFRTNAEGDLINLNGQMLQGWNLDDNGNIAGALSKINIPNAISPKTTSTISFEDPTNLDSTSPTITYPTTSGAGAFDPNDSTTFNYVNSLNVFDSLGNRHELSYYFEKTGANTWDVHVYADGDTTTQVGTTTLTFDSSGTLTGGSPANISVALTNGAATPLTISAEFTNMKQLASGFIFYSQQDGNAKGDLFQVSISEDGIVKGSYTNGKVKDIARIGIATFKDKEMLVRKGSSLYVPNQQVFTPIITPGGVISKVRSGMLEMSNVDISKEFIGLITAQRAYQANARTITTADQVLQETMNIKR